MKFRNMFSHPFNDWMALILAVFWIGLFLSLVLIKHSVSIFQPFVSLVILAGFVYFIFTFISKATIILKINDDITTMLAVFMGLNLLLLLIYILGVIKLSDQTIVVDIYIKSILKPETLMFLTSFVYCFFLDLFYLYQTIKPRSEEIDCEVEFIEEADFEVLE